MKNKSGFSSTVIILAVAIIGFGGFLTWAIVRNQASTTEIIGDYDRTKIIPASENSGNIEEHVEGNPNADLVIVEYSDYQCSGCASVVDDVEQLVEKYGDKIAIVHRTYVLSYHDNGTAAAIAVESAGLQGYWKKYGDYLFENQSDWFYSDASKRTDQFVSYFNIVTEGKGDVDKFIADMSAENTKAKVNFDISLAKQVKDKIQYTPAFFINDEFVDWAYDNKDNVPIVDYFSNIIDEKLGLEPEVKKDTEKKTETEK